MLGTFFSVTPIFLLIAFGFITNKKINNLDSFWKISDKFVYYIFFPALLINDIGAAQFTLEDTNTYIPVTITSTIIIAISLIALKYIIKIPDKEFTSIFQGGVRYNSYVFIALSQSIFGDEGVALSGIFIAYMIILTNVTTVIIMNIYGDNTNKGIAGTIMALAKNPLIIGAITGMVLQLSGIQLINVIKQFFTYLGNAATPLSLMSVGAGLIIKLHLKKIFYISLSCFAKLIIMPLITISIILYFGLSGTGAGIAVLYSAMPCAGNAYILARQMGGDHEIMASIITWTTLFSGITITIIFGLFPFFLQI